MDFGKRNFDKERQRMLKRLATKIDYDIDTVGHSVMLTQLELPTHRVSMSYSIGLSLKGPNDFVILGLPVEYAREVIAHLARLSETGELSPDFATTYPCEDKSPMCDSAIHQSGIVYRDDVFSGYRCAILPLHGLPQALNDIVPWQVYKGREISSKFCQVVLPDKNNLFPWEGGENQASCPVLAQVDGMPASKVLH